MFMTSRRSHPMIIMKALSVAFLPVMVISLQLETDSWLTFPLSDFGNGLSGYTKEYSPTFKMLGVIDDAVYVGGNETLLKLRLSSDDFNQVNYTEKSFPTDEPGSPGCRSFSAPIQCWNYIRIAAEMQSPGDILVCGTNAQSRLCYRCNGTLDCTKLTGETPSRQIVPKDYDTNPSAFVLPGTGSSYLVYSSNVEGPSFMKFLIQDTAATLQLQTSNSRLEILDDPTFVGKPFSSNQNGVDYVFFLFRETAVEYSNHGKIIYSRIGRVCQNETNSAAGTVETYESYVKARLNCSIPDLSIPYYYNEIQDMIWDPKNESVYAVFTSQELGPKASAMCKFRMADIMKIFDGGEFKQQSGNRVNYLWLPVSPIPRPGQCGIDPGGNYPPLLDHLVPNDNPQAPPVLPPYQDSPPSDLMTSTEPILSVDGVRFTYFVKDPSYECVYFFGTTTGTVIKAHKLDCNDTDEQFKSVEINELFKTSGPVTGMELLTNTDEGVKHLVITSDHNVVTWPLNVQCSARNKQECDVLRSPYCRWNESVKACQCALNATGCQNVDPQVLVQPSYTNVTSCNNEEVVSFCIAAYGPYLIGNFTMQWKKVGDDGFFTGDSKHLVKTAQIADNILELRVTVLNVSAGIYECTTEHENVTITKRVNIIQEVCLTKSSLDRRCEEHTRLEKMSNDLSDTCTVRVQPCDTCPFGFTATP